MIRLLLVAMTFCVVCALIASLDDTGTVFGAGYVPWLIGALLAWVLDLMVGARLVVRGAGST